MTAAINWALTQEGVSDLRRFWNGKPTDFSIDELVAFFNTLPDEAATRKAVLGYDVSLNNMLTALMVDSIRELHMALARKKLKDSDRLFKSLNGSEAEKDDRFERMAQQVMKKKTSN